MSSIRTISPTTARRLAITRQRLAGPPPCSQAEAGRRRVTSQALDRSSGSRVDASDIMEVMRDLGCLQLDPISAVARSHLLVLWSRLGNYDRAELDKLLWQERQLFEYWAHGASIVPTEDYPIHQVRMRDYPVGDSKFARRVRDWMKQNKSLRRILLSEMRRKGPLPSRYFEEMGVPSAEWVSTGWTGGRNISRMLDFLWMQGKIMVAGRAGLQKLWDLAERCLPEWTPRERLSNLEMVRRAAQKSLRSLGVANSRQIVRHYVRLPNPDLGKVLAELQAAQRIERVEIVDRGQPWKGDWYIHTDDLPLLERMERGEWEPRTTLLSPFDNLISDRGRTQQLFNFKFGLEIYVPRVKRQYGYYVLPILHGDRLIGRIDPVMDRTNGRLTINAAHAEPDALMTKASGKAVRHAIEDLGAFLGAKEIVTGPRVPAVDIAASGAALVGESGSWGRDIDTSPEIFEAIKANDAAKARELLVRDPALANAQMTSGLSAVLLAAYYGRKEIIELLLASGARLNLFEASAVGKLDRVAEILNNQPDLVNDYASDGFTPLGLASFFGHAGVVKLLLERDAKVNIASNNAQHVMPLHSAVAARHLEIAEALLEHGGDANAKQQEGITPLQEAAQNGQVEMARLLLKHGADVNARKDDGQTALAMAEQHGRQDVADLLRRHGARE